jgi:glucose-6-phosphate isomerase/transaldolase/glucose-6-phosphate isomerase
VTITSEELLERLQRGSTMLWPLGNVASTRLGWLESPKEMEREAGDLRHWADSIDQEIVILLGMGGSSLGAAVLAAFAESFGTSNGRRLVVCDTTEPSTVVAAPFEEAFVIVSSKSGTTLESNVLFDYAMTRQRNPRRYAVITDPGTPLWLDAKAKRVARVFEGRPDIGGRYSVLSYFGMVPAALMGYDIAELAGRALEGDHHEAVDLGVRLGQAALEGRDKATILVEGKARPFGLWAEQLIAESTGKLGRGIVPVPTDEAEDGEDRELVRVEFDEAHELGAAFYRFEIATAVAGHVLDLDPFDEPNVAESKANTGQVLAQLPLPAQSSEPPGALAPFLEDEVRPGDYVSIQAYLPYGSEAELEQLRKKIRDAHEGMAVTAGYGPRFLHSTGQLHKAGPNSVIAVQLVANSPREQLSIPDQPFDFATLIDAQAIGDRESLLSHRRRVVTIAIDELSELL